MSKLGRRDTIEGLGLCKARDELTDRQNNRVKVRAHGAIFMPAGRHELHVLFIAPLETRRSKAFDDLCNRVASVIKTRQYC